MDFNRDSFPFHGSWYYAISRLDDESRLEVYDAIMRKALYNESPHLDGLANFAMTFVEPQIEQDLDKWLDIREKRKESGKKGGLAKQANGSKCKQKVANATPNTDVDNDFIERVYKLYPSKCPVRGISTGKCSKDKKRIEGLLKTYSKEDIERVITKEVEDKLGKFPLKNFSTFLNNFPDPNDLFSTQGIGYPQSVDDVKDDDVMPSYAYYNEWVYKRCKNLWENIKELPRSEAAYQALVNHTIGGARGVCYVTLVLNRDGWEKYNDERGFMYVYANYVKANGMFKE